MGIGVEGIHKGKEGTGGMPGALWAWRSSLRKAG